MFDPLWKKAKILQGLDQNIWTKSTPKDKDHVDRIQVVRYPDGSGYLEPHRHPSENLLWLAVSVYLSQINKKWDDNSNEIVTDTITKFTRGNDYNISANFNTKLYGILNFKKSINDDKSDGKK